MNDDLLSCAKEILYERLKGKEVAFRGWQIRTVTVCQIRIYFNPELVTLKVSSQHSLGKK
jgi:hypothetical protein